MALVVEDGTGKADADAFASLAYVNAHHTSLGNSTWTGTDADKEAAIRRATAYLSESIAWDGLRTRGRAQALAWPRSGMVDADGNGIHADQMPVELLKATAEVALRELVTPGTMTPDFTPADAVRSERVGDIAVEYLDVPATADARRPIVSAVRDLLAPFLRPAAATGGMFGRAYRV